MLLFHPKRALFKHRPVLFVSSKIRFFSLLPKHDRRIMLIRTKHVVSPKTCRVATSNSVQISRSFCQICISSEFLSLTFKIKRQEAPHDGWRPPGSDGAMLSEMALRKQRGIVVKLKRDLTCLAKCTSGQRKCPLGDEGRLTNRRHHMMDGDHGGCDRATLREKAQRKQEDFMGEPQQGSTFSAENTSGQRKSFSRVKAD